MSELARYEAAERAIAAAEAVDEVLEIRSQATAWAAYAKQAKNRELEIKAARIRFRAEKRLGEMLIAAKEAGQVRGGRPDKNPSSPEGFSDDQPITRVTLREAGIDHKLSSKAQRLAAMDAAEFEQALERHAEEMRAGQGRVAMDLHKIGAEEKGRAHRRNLAAVLSEQSVDLPAGQLVPAVYLDPPWRRQGGIGDRAYENHYPTMTWPEILDYLRQVAPRLLPDSWAFMWIPRPHLLALVEIELEVMVKATGEMTPALLDVPLAWACGQALGMDSYSTCYVWTKTDEAHPDVSGSGLLVWDQDELLLQFKRGRGLPKPAGSEKFGSNHRERATDHSRKPEHYRRMIAAMVGCDDDGRPLPVLELFARVDAEHPLPPGWIASGNQAAAPAGVISNATDAAPSPSSPRDADAEREAFVAYRNAQDEARLWQHPAIADRHVIRMTRDYQGEAAFDVATCQCGWSFRGAAARFNLAREHANDAHWREVIEGFAAGMPSDAGETVTAAADATSDGASAAAAVADIVSAIGELGDRAPYDAGDVIAIDQLAGSDYLAPADRDALELEQLQILSDFCHPKRRALENVLGPIWAAREMAYLSGGQWQLREAGRLRLRALLDAIAPPAPVALTEPYRSPQPSLFDCPAPEVVDGALQTRLPVDDDELAEQLALMAVDAGGTIDGEIARHLCGKDYLHATTKALQVTELGRAFLAQLVGPASRQQQGAEA